MLPDLTPAVERALDAARELARAVGALDVQPLHLLHGLLAEDEGRAATLLSDGGVDAAAARTALRDLAISRQTVVGSSSQTKSLPLRQSLEAIFPQARELAGELYLERTIPSDALLLVLLREEADLRRSLEALGLDFLRLESAVLALRKPPIQLDEPLHLVEPAEQIDTARIIDAAANRAREALRVIEDYSRFALDDAFLSGECKRLRHDLAGTLGGLSAAGLLEARDTLHDVGTTIATDREAVRHSLRSGAGQPEAVARSLAQAWKSSASCTIPISAGPSKHCAIAPTPWSERFFWALMLGSG